MDPGWVAALVALLAAVAGCLAWSTRWAWRILRALGHFLDDWRGEPARDGRAQTPGVMARLGSVEELVRSISAEVQPNHGTSLRDAVNATAGTVDAIRAEQERIKARLNYT